MEPRNPITHEAVLSKLGIRVYANQSHDNIFMVTKIGETSYHGGGLYCIFSTQGYEVPLCSIHRSDGSNGVKPNNEGACEFDDQLTESWAELCEKKGIRVYKRGYGTTVFNENKATIQTFFDYLTKKYN